MNAAYDSLNGSVTWVINGTVVMMIMEKFDAVHSEGNHYRHVPVPIAV